MSTSFNFETNRFLKNIKDDYSDLYGFLTEDFREKAKLPMDILEFNKKFHSILLNAYKIFDFDKSLNTIIGDIAKARKRGRRVGVVVKMKRLRRKIKKERLI